MTLIGLDLNSSRARAVQGAHRGNAQPLALEDRRADLTMALALDGRSPVVGRSALRICRTEPHEACLDFLPHIGRPHKWIGDRHHLDAGQALSHCFAHLRARFGKADPSITLAVPTYLTNDQQALISTLALESRLRVPALVSAPLAAVLSARQLLPWSGMVLVLDADSHALTWSLVELGNDKARLIATNPVAKIGSTAWLARLLDQIAQRSIQTTRRDPRESGEAEQGLYDQLRYFLERGFPEGRIDLSLQMGTWSQLLMIPSREIADFCVPLARRALAELQAMLRTPRQAPIVAVLVTQDAARLPGLLTTIEPEMRRLVDVGAPPPGEFDIDLNAEGLDTSQIQVLPANALANGAHDVAIQVQRGELGRGFLEIVSFPTKGSSAAPRGITGATRRNQPGAQATGSLNGEN